MPIQAAKPPPAYAVPIIIGNAVPLAGVLLWEWSVFELFMIYWVENMVAGLFTLIAILAAGARGGWKGFARNLGMGAFFTAHYGLFCMAHGVFVLSLFYRDQFGQFNVEGLFAPLYFIVGPGVWHGFVWALAGIVLVQSVQAARLWPELMQQKAERIMMAPYQRVMILHVALILGGLLAMALSQPVMAVLMLGLLKTAFDLGLVTFHKKQRKDGHDGR